MYGSTLPNGLHPDIVDFYKKIAPHISKLPQTHTQSSAWWATLYTISVTWLCRIHATKAYSWLYKCTYQSRVLPATLDSILKLTLVNRAVVPPPLSDVGRMPKNQDPVAQLSLITTPHIHVHGRLTQHRPLARIMVKVDREHVVQILLSMSNHPPLVDMYRRDF